MSRVLTQLDELPRHQTNRTFDMVADSSPHWSDGYYFTMGDPDGRYAWFMGFRLYANTDVLDAFTCVSVAPDDCDRDEDRDLGETCDERVGGATGRQHNMRWSRRLRPMIDELACGPMSVEIVKGLHIMRLRCEPNDYGQEFDLTFTGVHPPYLEQHVVVIVDGRVQSDRSNYDQACVVTGWFTVDGRRVEVDGWTGVRDHSWGVGSQTGGPKSPATAPPSTPPQHRGLRQWCMFKMRDRVLWWQFHHHPQIGFTMSESQCIPTSDGAGPPVAYDSIDHDTTFVVVDGAPVRRLDHSIVTLTTGGATERYRIEPISYPVYLQGGGYHGGFDDQMGRGVYRGSLVHEGEQWGIDRATSIALPDVPGKQMNLNRYDYAEAWGRCTNLDDPTDVGDGHLECVVLGPYPGFE